MIINLKSGKVFDRQLIFLVDLQTILYAVRCIYHLKYLIRLCSMTSRVNTIKFRIWYFKWSLLRELVDQLVTIAESKSVPNLFSLYCSSESETHTQNIIFVDSK